MEPIVRLSLRKTVIWMCLLQLNCSHKAVTHVFKLLGNLPGRALEFVCDLFLLGWFEDIEALTAGTVMLEGEKEETSEAESLQVAVNDVFHRHVVRAVHEMVSADHTVSFLPHIPGGKMT